MSHTILKLKQRTSTTKRINPFLDYQQIAPLPSGSRNLHVPAQTQQVHVKSPNSCAYGDRTQRNKAPPKPTSRTVAPPYFGTPPPGDIKTTSSALCVSRQGKQAPIELLAYDA